jgi:hypothetical protein
VLQCHLLLLLLASLAGPLQAALPCLQHYLGLLLPASAAGGLLYLTAVQQQRHHQHWQLHHLCWQLPQQAAM